jgi:hypothetical protein
MGRIPKRTDCCPLAPETWLCNWPEEGGPRLSASLRPGDPLPRPTHHRCLWRGRMQSGERERAGSGSQRDERLQEDWPGGGSEQAGQSCWWQPRAGEPGRRQQCERCVVTMIGDGAGHARSRLGSVDDARGSRTEGHDAGRPDAAPKSVAATDPSDWLFDPLGTAFGWMAERIVRAGKAVGKALIRRRA